MFCSACGANVHRKPKVLVNADEAWSIHLSILDRLQPNAGEILCLPCFRRWQEDHPAADQIVPEPPEPPPAALDAGDAHQPAGEVDAQGNYVVVCSCGKWQSKSPTGRRKVTTVSHWNQFRKHWDAKARRPTGPAGPTYEQEPML